MVSGERSSSNEEVLLCAESSLKPISLRGPLMNAVAVEADTKAAFRVLNGGEFVVRLGQPEILESLCETLGAELISADGEWLRDGGRELRVTSDWRPEEELTAREEEDKERFRGLALWVDE